MQFLTARFRLLGVPVEVHLTHVLFVPLLAVLVAPSHGWAAHVPGLARVALVALIISGTLLSQELALALAARAFGYRPVVQLIGMTGRSLPNPNETVPWQREVAMQAAGPGAGISLGFLFATALIALKGTGGLAEYALQVACAAQWIWSAVNLVPVHPLKGGRIVTAVAMRVWGRNGFLYAQALGLLVAVGLALLAAVARQPLGFFALIYIGQTLVLIGAFRRGVLPQSDRHPLEIATEQAEARFRDQDYEGTRRAVQPLLEADLQPSLRARLHLLLGWVALKLGEGRAALDHFSQSAGAQVPPYALAAAFSLIGDEERALPLWERAARNSDDPTLWHEWAGSLIRSGRKTEALRIPGLHLPAAYEAATRVCLARGDFSGAAAIVEQRCADGPSAALAYQAAQWWAKALRPDDALRMLELAAQHGFADLQRALLDEDLSSLRSHHGFGAFLEGLRAGTRH